MAVKQDTYQLKVDILTDQERNVSKSIVEIDRLKAEITKTKVEVEKLTQSQEASAKKIADTTAKITEKQKAVAVSTIALKEALAKGDAETAKNLEYSIKQGEKSVKRYESVLKNLKNDHLALADSAQLVAEKEALIAQNLAKIVAEGGKLKQIDLSKVSQSSLTGVSRSIGSVRQNVSDPKVQADLIASEKAVNDQLANLRQRTKGVSVAMDDARKSSQGFLGGLSQSVAVAVGAFYTLKQSFSGLFKASELASEIEGTRLALETIIGSKRKADQVVAEIIKLAASTPFETTELIEYTKRLLAMGVETDKVIPSMRALGDVAAGVGKDKLDQLVLAYGQVAAKTKLAGGELKQFTEAGVPLVGQLAKQFGVTESAIFKMVEKGKIGFKDVEKAFQNMTGEGGKFFNLMGKQSQTVTGLSSTLKDNLTLALAAFGKGFNESIKEILRSLINLSNGLNTQKIEEFGRSVGSAAKFLFDFGPTIARIVTLFVGYRAAIGVAQVAQALFNTTMLANPIGLIGAGIVLAVNAMQLYAAKVNEVTASQKALTDVRDEANRTATEEIKRSNELFGVLKDETVSRDTRHQAFLRLQELYPSVLKDYKTEESLLGNLETAHRKVNESILAEAFAKAQAQKVSQITNEIIDLQIKKAEAEAKQREANAKFGTQQNQKPKPILGLGDALYQNQNASQTINNLVDANAELAAITGQINEKMGSVKTVTDATNQSFVAMAQSLGTTSLAFNRFDAEIDVLNKRLKDNPADEVSKNRLEAVKKAKEAEAKDIVRGEEKKKTIKAEADKDAESAAKKAANARLKQLEADTQAAVNAATLTHLKKGELEKDFETDLLKIKAEGLTKELAFADKNRKILVGEAEKKEADLIKTERAIREKTNTQAFTDLKEAVEKRQTALELELANGLITEEQYKIRSLDIKRGEYAEKLQLLKDQGKKSTEEYAKTVLEQAKTERQISTATLDESLLGIKNATAKKLDVVELEYQEGKLSEAEYQAAKLVIVIEGINAQLAALEAAGNKESDLYRQLGLQKSKAQHDEIDRQISVELEAIRGMGEAEAEELAKRFQQGRISRNEYDLLVLQDKEAVLRKELEILRAHRDATKKEQTEIEGQITKIVKSEAEKRNAIEQEKVEKRYKAVQDISSAIKDLIAVEIEGLSKTTEEKKKNGAKIKKLQKAEMVISSTVEIANIFKGFSALPVIGQVLAAVQAGVALARLNSGLKRIDAQQFAKGGLTGPGMSYTDSTGERPAGIVHANEYVIPRRIVQNAEFAPIIRQLESLRLRGYAEGGFVNTTPLVSFAPTPSVAAPQMDMGVMLEIKGLRQDMSNWNTRLKAVIVRNEYEEAAKRDKDDRAAAAL